MYVDKQIEMVDRLSQIRVTDSGSFHMVKFLPQFSQFSLKEKRNNNYSSSDPKASLAQLL